MPLPDQRLIEWLHPSENPALNRGDLHLWRVDLDQLGAADDLEPILSPDENTRAQRLLSSEKRAVFIAGRAALRMILASYLQLTPEAIRFKYEDKGKPSLAAPYRPLDFRFNLSHSGRWMVLGVCRDAEVGVDIEEIQPVQNMWALEQLFSDGERETLANLPGNERDAAFIAFWTAKEAAAKADGGGLSGHQAFLTMNAEPTNELWQDGFTFFRNNSCWFLGFEPAHGYLGCAAVKTDQLPRVRCFEFLPYETSKNSREEM